MTKRGHSNAHVEQAEVHGTVTDAAIIPLEGGATVYTVKELPSLVMRKSEWRTLGDRMNWWRSTDGSGGTIWIEFHDRGGRVAVDELSLTGIHEAMFQCTQMLEELETAKESLDAAEEMETA